MATLDAQIVETQARIEQVCGEKDAMLDEVRALRAEGGKPTPEQIKKGIGAIHGCSQAKADLTKLEADEVFQRLVKSIRGEG